MSGRLFYFPKKGESMFKEEAVEPKEFVLRTWGPDVKFTGALAGAMTEDGVTWTVYRTVGGNWVVSRSTGDATEVRNYKKTLVPICQWMKSCKRVEDLKALESSRGLSQKEIEFVSRLSPELKSKFVLEIE